VNWRSEQENAGLPEATGWRLPTPALGDGEKVFVLLEKSFERHTGIIFLLKSEPMFEPLDSDPRYRDLLIRIGLPPESLPPLAARSVAGHAEMQKKTQNKKQ